MNKEQLLLGTLVGGAIVLIFGVLLGQMEGRVARATGVGIILFVLFLWMGVPTECVWPALIAIAATIGILAST